MLRQLQQPSECFRQRHLAHATESQYGGMYADPYVGDIDASKINAHHKRMVDLNDVQRRPLRFRLELHVGFVQMQNTNGSLQAIVHRFAPFA